MLGAIIGDMAGSIYEFKHNLSKEFDIYNKRMRMTDDSLLTIAVAKTLMNNYPISYDTESVNKLQKELIHNFVNSWKINRGAGFGGMFYDWCVRVDRGEEALPYNSYGNGSAMRISPVGWIANSEEEVKTLSRIVTEVTHNHPEGIKGAEAVAMAIYLARNGYTKEEIRDRMIKEYYRDIEHFRRLDSVRNIFFDNETCQGTVPQAIYCFLESTSLEDAIRNCIYLGGDCDTTAAMAGAIAEAFYQKDTISDLEKRYMSFMIVPEVVKLIKNFHKMIGSKKFKRRRNIIKNKDLPL